MLETPVASGGTGTIPGMEPCDNPSGADNEQGSPTEVELAWLAGVFDGEGWIGLNKQRRSNSSHLRYTGAAVVATTSPKLAERIRDILTRLDVKCYYVETPAKLGADGSWRRHKWNISVSSNKMTARFLSAIRPYLVEKQNQADLVLEYIAWRAGQPARPGGHNQTVILGMKEKAEEVRKALHEDRWSCDPSTTTRLAPALTG